MTKKTTMFFKYLILTIVSLISVFPIYWMVVSATNKSIDIIKGRLLPGTYLFDNYKNLISGQNLKIAMINSTVTTVGLTIISIVVCSIAGYAFEVYNTKVKDGLMNIILLAMMVPFASIMIPLFQLFSKLGLINSALGFILPYIATPFLIMLFRQSTKAFPKELIEAARIDGLNEMRIFFKIYIPTMKPTYAAAITVVFMFGWNAYLWPKVIMIDPNSTTMPMLISNIIAGYVTDYGMLMLAVTICTIPTAILFFFLQRSFADGITGAVKG